MLSTSNQLISQIASLLLAGSDIRLKKVNNLKMSVHNTKDSGEDMKKVEMAI